MPFAKKYRFTMRLPDPGGKIGAFLVESCEVGHEGRGDGTYEYPFEMTLSGPGGKQGVGKAIREKLGTTGRTTFSGYGSPYQLRLGRFSVESLGNGRYKVTGRGTGVRFDLERELRRFVAYARLRGRGADDDTVGAYIEDYKRDVTRKNPELEY
jgi:hypothetical protein